MSYADKLRGGRSGPRAPVQGLPLHHGIFQQKAIFIDLRAVSLDYTLEERDSFLKEDLGLAPEDVRDIFVDHSTLLLHLTVASSCYSSVLDRLFAGVPWTTYEGRLVYGWAAAEPPVAVRVAGVPRDFPAKDLRRHFESFGLISKFERTSDRTWSSAANGVFLIYLRVGHGVVLPHYVNVVDPQGVLCERFPVYVDGRHRHCFRCGGTGHLGAFCKASCLAPEATPALWSSLIYTGGVLAPAAVAEVATSDQAAADVVAASKVVVGTAPSVALASPTAAVAAAPSSVAVPAAALAVPAASAEPPAATKAASVNLAASAKPAIVVAASVATVAVPAAKVVAAEPQHGCSGSASSASDMSGAEEEDSAAGGLSLPRRRRRRSTQLGSPGSGSPNKKTHKKEPG